MKGFWAGCNHRASSVRSASQGRKPGTTWKELLCFCATRSEPLSPIGSLVAARDLCCILPVIWDLHVLDLPAALPLAQQSRACGLPESVS